MFYPARRIAYSQREQISKAIDELQAKEFVQSVVTVVKRNGEICHCCDYRKLNAKAIAKQFPLPCVDELIDNMRNLSIYSVIDLNSRYFQISLKEEDREKTALFYHGENINESACLKVYQVPNLPLLRTFHIFSVT